MNEIIANEDKRQIIENTTANIDLHIHSRYSDGSDEPREIVRKAKELGLEVIALTDHDTIGGCEEFIQAGREFDVKTIPGIELSIEDYDGIKEIHLLAYFPNLDSFANARPALEKYSKERIDIRNRRLDQQLVLLANAGLYIEKDDVLAEAGGDVIGRRHIALVIKRKYDSQFATLQDVFEDYLEEGGKAYVPMEKRMRLDKAIEWVHNLGGLAVLAHPGVSNTKKKEVSIGERLIMYAISFGVDGGEGWYVYHKNNPYLKEYPSKSQEICQIYIDILLRHDKMVTAGSDYHGSKKSIELGEHKGVAYNLDRMLC